MDDARIVELYWQRNEAAIRETDNRYGTTLHRVANHILDDRRDSDEAVNDTYLRAWNAMPPHRPTGLCAFLCKITRQLSIDRLRRRGAHKRQGMEYALSLEELDECVSGTAAPTEDLDLQVLVDTIEAWLERQSSAVREAFVRRYFFAEPLRNIAARQGSTVAQVKSMLHRARLGLRDYLIREGYDL